MGIDKRLLQIGIETNGVIKNYTGLAIKARGMKFANPNQDECEVTITNMDKTTRDFILNETSPFNTTKKPKRLIVSAGRESYGLSQIFIGDITKAKISQPPDIELTIHAQTGNFHNGKTVTHSGGGSAKLSQISKFIAGQNDKGLNFQAKDKSIANFHYAGSASGMVDKIEESGEVDAYIDGDTLVVKDSNVPLTGELRKLDLDSGMIGIPEFTERGIKVAFLLDNHTKVGSGLQITSILNSSINGIYVIYKLGFEITNRDTPFYYSAECVRLP